MDKRIDLFKLLKNEGKLETVLVYPATNTVNDPFENTTDTSFLNPVPVKVYVDQIGFGALKYKYWGQLAAGSIKIICETKYYNLFLLADKIEYNDNLYYLYKDDAKRFSIMQNHDYLTVILERKNA